MRPDHVLAQQAIKPLGIAGVDRLLAGTLAKRFMVFVNDVVGVARVTAPF